MNATNKVVGGPFTRFDPSDPENNHKKSSLSFCLVSNELFTYVDCLTIDKEKRFTPFRTISKKKVIFTDHYSLLLFFKNIPLRPRNIGAGNKVTRWNTIKEGGWEVYRQMTTNNNNLEEIAKEPSEDSNMIMKKLDNELNRVKSEAFGKVKERKNNGGCKELHKLQK